MLKKLKAQLGFSSLLIVSFVGIIVLTMAVTISSINILNIRTNVDFYNSKRAKAIINACGEEILQNIRDSETFTGSGTLNISDYSCDYLVIDTGDENREIQTEIVIGDIYQREKIIIDQINPQINISSWQEVADF